MRPEGDDPERIDLIAVDPIAFDDRAFDDRAFDYKAIDEDNGRSRQIQKAVGILAVVAVAAVVWLTKSEPEWRIFETAPVPAAGLTEELVFDRPPGQLLSADLAPPPVDVKPQLGYVFSEPGGTILSRRWASFRTRSTNLPSAPASAGPTSVNGVPADVRQLRLRRIVAWGPLDGRSWTVTTNKLDEDQSVEFANSVAIIAGRPALAHSYNLGAMRPVGSVAALDCVMLLTDLFNGERRPGPVLPTLLTWTSPDGKTLLGSIAAPLDALPLVEFVLNAGQPITVHGLAGVMIESRVLGTVVAWLEDGRLIMVVGDSAEDRLIALAESVRPATAAEWSVVGHADVRSPEPVFEVGAVVTL